MSRPKKQAAELGRANKVKNEFLNFVSHELRMPVHTIMGYAAIMQDGHYGQLSREQKRAIEKITSQSKDLLRVSNTLLEAIRLESGSVTVEIDELRLNSFLNELKSNFDIALKMLLKKKLSLSGITPPRPPCRGHRRGKTQARALKPDP